MPDNIKKSGVRLIIENASKFFSLLRKAEKGYDELGKSAVKADKQVTSANKSMAQSSDALSRAGTNAKKAGDALEGAGKKSVTATTNATKGVKSFASFIPSVGTLAAGAFGLATIAATKFANQSLNEFKRFETGITEVFTLLPEVGAQGLQELQSELQSFSVDIGRLTTETTPALYQALSAGVPQDNVFNFLEEANRTALGGVTDLNTAIDLLTSVTNAYGEEVISVGRANDILFTTVRLGKTTIQELSREVADITPIMADLGVNFEDGAAALATLTSRGIKTAEAATQIKSALNELSDSASVVSKAFEGVAGKSFRQFIADGGNLSQALQVVAQASDETGLAFNELFGSIEASSAVSILAGKGAADFASNLEQVTNSTGAAADAADKFSGTLEVAERATRASTEAMKLQIGEALKPLKIQYFEVTKAIADYITQQAKLEVAQNKANEALGEAGFNFSEIDSIIDRLERDPLTGKLAGDERLLERLAIFTKIYGENADATVAQLLSLTNQQDKLNNKLSEAESFDKKLIESNRRLTRIKLESSQADSILIRSIQNSIQAKELDRQKVEELRKEYEKLAGTLSGIVSSAYSRAETAAANFAAGQALLEESQGEFRSGVINNAVAVRRIEEQLIGDISDDQKQDLQNRLNELRDSGKEFSAEYADILRQISNDKSQSQRDQLLLDRAKLIEENGRYFEGVFGADKEAIKRANEQIAAALDAIDRNRRQVVLDLVKATGGTATGEFLQQLDLRIALNLITPEQADLLRQEREYLDTISLIFGDQGIVQIDDVTTTIGSLLLAEENGPQLVAQLQEQISNAISAGQGARIVTISDLIVRLTARGDIDTSEIDTAIAGAIDALSTGRAETAAEAVAITLKPEIDVPDVDIGAQFADEAEVIEIEARIAEKEALIADFETLLGLGDEINEQEPETEFQNNADEASREVESYLGVIRSIPSNVTTRFTTQFVEEGQPPRSRPGGKGSAGGGATPFQSGGFTGFGDPSSVAGVVHRGEIVVPANFVRGGLSSMVQFMLANTPQQFLGANIAKSGDTVTTNITNDNRRVFNGTFNDNQRMAEQRQRFFK